MLLRMVLNRRLFSVDRPDLPVCSLQALELNEVQQLFEVLLPSMVQLALSAPHLCTQVRTNTREPSGVAIYMFLIMGNASESPVVGRLRLGLYQHCSKRFDFTWWDENVLLEAIVIVHSILFI